MTRKGAGDRDDGLFVILGIEEVKGWEDEFGPLDLSGRKAKKFESV